MELSAQIEPQFRINEIKPDDDAANSVTEQNPWAVFSP